MPIILKKENVEKWINNEKYSFSSIQNFLDPYLTDLVFHNVSPLINSTKNNSIECIQKVKDPFTINLFQLK